MNDNIESIIDNAVVAEERRKLEHIKNLQQAIDSSRVEFEQLKQAVAKLIVVQSEKIKRYEKVLAFYADPEIYHAIMFVPDPPSGDFINDFSESHGHLGYSRAMPGKAARRVLGLE